MHIIVVVGSKQNKQMISVIIKFCFQKKKRMFEQPRFPDRPFVKVYPHPQPLKKIKVYVWNDIET